MFSLGIKTRPPGDALVSPNERYPMLVANGGKLFEKGYWTFIGNFSTWFISDFFLRNFHYKKIQKNSFKNTAVFRYSSVKIVEHHFLNL